MSVAKNGDTVKIKYVCKIEDGKVFDQSADDQPFVFTLGKGMVIPGLEEAVVGMNIGDMKTITLPPDDAYGQYSKDRMLEVDRKELPDDLKLEVGLTVEMQRPDGQKMPVIVFDITDEKVTFDANHPLSGRTVTFEIELLEIA